MDQYQKIEKLGEGSYGIVYKAKHKSSRIIIILDLEDQGIPAAGKNFDIVISLKSEAIREISILKDFKHPNIVCLYDVIHSEKKLTLVFEYLDSDLRKFIDNHKDQLDLARTRNLTRQLLEGIHYCHKNKVLHRDLKPQNLLIDRKLHLKIGDFGLARTFELPVKEYSYKVVTLWYRAPDVLIGSLNYTSSIDMWSVGCILGEMALGRPLFPGNSDKDQLNTIFSILGTPNNEVWPTLKNYANLNFGEKHEKTSLRQVVPSLGESGIDLLEKILQYEPDNRITASEALRHKFISEF